MSADSGISLSFSGKYHANVATSDRATASGQRGGRESQDPVGHGTTGSVDVQRTPVHQFAAAEAAAYPGAATNVFLPDPSSVDQTRTSPL